MKSEEKSTNKEKQTLIIRKYHQYLKLEKHSHPIQWMLTKQTYRSCCTFWKERVSLSLTLPWMTCSILPPDCTTSASIPLAGTHLVGHQVIFPFPRHSRLPGGRPQRTVGGPKIGFKLPEVLTVEEIDRIISAIDLGTNEGNATGPSSRLYTVAAYGYRNCAT